MNTNSSQIHPCFPQPPNSEIMAWKYMDLSKLLNILLTEKLHFTRIDLLEDNYEGSTTKLNYYIRERDFMLNNLSHITELITRSNRHFTKMQYVNCWRIDDSESEAMWNLYCPDKKGIALQTTYKKLLHSIEHDKSLHIGLVKYIDYENDYFEDGNMFSKIMHKRKAFEHEKEVRIVKADFDYAHIDSVEPPKGFECPWDIGNTVQNIYINPYASNWYSDTVMATIEKFELNIPTLWSQLKSEVYF